MALIAFIVSDRLFASYCYNRFLPAKKLNVAEQRGPGCIVVTGDSRMAAGFDAQGFEQAFRKTGTSACIVDLSVGALNLAGQFALLRQFIEDGLSPSLVVVASVPEALLEEQKIKDPGDWIGNEASLLIWSRASDATLHFPKGTDSLIQRWDKRLRFTYFRSTGFGTYRSLLWSKVQSLQDRIRGISTKPSNQFGAMEDMATLAETFRQQALAAYRANKVAGEWTWSPWLSEIEKLANASGTKLCFAELPMPKLYREEVHRNVQAQDLRSALRSRLPNAKVLDLSDQPWLQEDLFSDGLHLGPKGARLLSFDLGLMLTL